MQSRRMFAAIAMLLATLPVRADDPPRSLQTKKARPAITLDRTDEKGVVSGGRVVNVTANVKAVDLATREVTLHGSGGRVETIRVGPEVKNLEKLERGDRVNIRYREGLVLRVQAPGGPRHGQGVDQLPVSLEALLQGVGNHRRGRHGLLEVVRVEAGEAGREFLVLLLDALDDRVRQRRLDVLAPAPRARGEVRPVAWRRGGHVLLAAHLADPHVGDAKLLGDLAARLGPDAFVQRLAGEIGGHRRLGWLTGCRDLAACAGAPGRIGSAKRGGRPSRKVGGMRAG